MAQAVSHQELHSEELAHLLLAGIVVSKAISHETALEDEDEGPEHEDAAEAEEASSERIDSREIESMNLRGKGNSLTKENHGMKMGLKTIRETS